jgi:hypothetical protein
MRHQATAIVVLLTLGAASTARALPDLVAEIFDVAVETGNVDPGDVDEGCAGGATGRTLLRFALRTRNVGSNDLVLGNPGCPDCDTNPGAACANPLFVCSLSHGHAHFESFAHMNLLDGNGAVAAEGHKYGFCLLDLECPNPQFNCSYQGITAGCADIYDAGLPCQYIDLTGLVLPPGTYTLRVTIDPDGVIAEANEANNVVDVPVEIDCTTPGGCTGVDPFLCYRARTTRDTPRFVDVPGVTLEDAFTDGTFDVVERRNLCTPSGVNGVSVRDGATHLTAYDLAPAGTTTPSHSSIGLVNQLGAIALDLSGPGRLMVPTAKSLTSMPPPPDPAAHGVDHYACYTARPARGTRPAAAELLVSDQFTNPAKRMRVKHVRQLCAPVDKNGEGVKDAARYLACYAARPARGEPRHPGVEDVRVSNQLGTGHLDTLREVELCLPSSRTDVGDLCADAVTLPALPVSILHDASGATVSADDPLFTSCGTGSGQHGHTVWFRLVAPATGTITADTSGSHYDTVLAARAGSCGSFTQLACNDDTSGVHARIVFPVVGGQTYYLEVASWGDTPAGSIALAVSFAP